VTSVVHKTSTNETPNPSHVQMHIQKITAKLHYIEPQGTIVSGSIYPWFEISHIHLFALIVARPFTIVR